MTTAMHWPLGDTTHAPDHVAGTLAYVDGTGQVHLVVGTPITAVLAAAWLADRAEVARLQRRVAWLEQERALWEQQRLPRRALRAAGEGA